MLWLCCFSFILAIAIITVSSTTTCNAALGKNASQSSVFSHLYGDLTGDKATDGNTDTRFQHCTGTAKYDFDAWWKVDLERNYILTSVIVTNRKAAANRLHDFTVAVSTHDNNPWILCGEYPGAVPTAATVTVTCDQAMWGRYVKITKPVTRFDDILSLCEVQVIAVERPYALLKHQIGKTTTSDVIVTMTGELLTCARTCKHTIDCLGINYNSEMNRCQLTNSTISEDTTFNNDWDFYVLLP